MAVKLENKHYKYAATVISGALLGSLVIIFLIFRPLLNANKSTALEVKDKKELLNALENKLNRLKELKVKEESLLVQRDRVLVALPEDKDVSRLFVQIENMITDAGASVESTNEGTAAVTAVAAAPEVKISGINNYTYGVKFKTSTYESIKNIITNLETALRIASLDSISIDSSSNSFSVNMNIKTYSRASEGGNK